MSPLLLPALAIAAGAGCGIWLTRAPVAAGALAAAAAAFGIVAALRPSRRRGVIVVCLAASAAGVLLASRDRETALHSSLRAVLDASIGGFGIDSIGPGGEHDPIATRLRLVEDAASAGDFIALRAEAVAVLVGGAWKPAAGGVLLSVGGDPQPADPDAWTSGRLIEAPVTFRRPARYFDVGVPDVERDLALAGTTLFGSIKSTLLVTIVERAGWLGELAARVRRYVRGAIDTTVGRHSSQSAAVVMAVLIGDRTGLPDAVRLRLQAAGTYHVIAISGGNIAILAALVLGVLMLAGVGGRTAAAGTVVVLVAYGALVTSGPSVWRATVMAVIYLLARSFDHRAGPWHAFAVAGVLMVIVRPLDVRDAGFLLTFGATAALLEVARRMRPFAEGRSRWRWVVDVVAASLAAEVALLPIAAASFSRVTLAGLVLNLVAVPVMGVVQVAGLAVVAAHAFVPGAAAAAGWVAHAGATALLESARLVDMAPWLTWRVPPPQPALVVGYYGSLAVLLFARSRGLRIVAAPMWVAAWLAIASGLAVPSASTTGGERVVRLTMFDVGQGESMLLELPDGSRTLLDTGGAPFGSGTFDIGGRVLAPALWAHGVRSLDALLVTHGDPDHLGGALSVVDDFDPRRFLEGIIVPRHGPSREARDAATRGGAAPVVLRAGMTWRAGDARIRVLHPPEPDWERPRVRNDDSVVVEVVYGTVAILLTGDISAVIERAILPQLTPSPVRVLKVGHHGSRTSTSRELLDAWRPHYALISAGRGNRFGHPTTEVIERLESAGARIYRTDQDGQITLTTDGRRVEVTTFTGGRQ